MKIMAKIKKVDDGLNSTNSEIGLENRRRRILADARYLGEGKE